MYNRLVAKPPTTTITVRVPVALKNRIEKVAKETRRSKSEITEEALETYADWNERITTRIRKAVAAMDRGEFATDEEVDAFFRKWKARAR